MRGLSRIPSSIIHCFDYCSFAVFSEVMLLVLFFFIRIALAIHIILGIICSSSVKNVMGNLIAIALNLYIALGGIVILTILNLPIFSAYMSFTSLVRFIPMVFFFLDAISEEIFFPLALSHISLLV